MSDRVQIETKIKRRFNVKKWRSLTTLLGLSFVLMLHYQNCAPAGGQSYAVGMEDDSLPVSVIDHINLHEAVGFSSKSVEIHSDVQSVAIEGICKREQEGAILAWKMSDSVTNQIFASGYEKCENGRFTVYLTPTQALNCGQDYELSTRIGLSQGGQVRVSRRCTPEVVRDASAMKAYLAVKSDSSCLLERSEDANQSCSVVCYSKDGVVEAQQEVDPVSCQI